MKEGDHSCSERETRRRGPTTKKVGWSTRVLNGKSHPSLISYAIVIALCLLLAVLGIILSYKITGHKGKKASLLRERAPLISVVWDESTSTEQLALALPVQVREASTIQVDGIVFYIGGYEPSSGAGVRQIQRLNVSSQQWHEPVAMPERMGDVHHAVCADSRTQYLYIVSGTPQQRCSAATPHVFCLHLETLTWHEVPALPKARAGAKCSVWNGALRVFGGRNPADNAVLPDDLILKVRPQVSKKWQSVEGLPGAGAVSNAVQHGRFLVALMGAALGAGGGDVDSLPSCADASSAATRTLHARGGSRVYRLDLGQGARGRWERQLDAPRALLRSVSATVGHLALFVGSASRRLGGVGAAGGEAAWVHSLQALDLRSMRWYTLAALPALPDALSDAVAWVTPQGPGPRAGIYLQGKPGGAPTLKTSVTLEYVEDRALESWDTGLYDPRSATPEEDGVVEAALAECLGDGGMGGMEIAMRGGREERQYEGMRLTWNRAFEGVQYPMSVALPASAQEVAGLLRCAARVGVHVCARNGKHSFEGDSSCSDGVVVDVTKMKAFDVVDALSEAPRAEQAGATRGSVSSKGGGRRLSESRDGRVNSGGGQGSDGGGSNARGGGWGRGGGSSRGARALEGEQGAAPSSSALRKEGISAGGGGARREEGRWGKAGKATGEQPLRRVMGGGSWGKSEEEVAGMLSKFRNRVWAREVEEQEEQEEEEERRRRKRRRRGAEEDEEEEEEGEEVEASGEKQGAALTAWVGAGHTLGQLFMNASEHGAYLPAGHCLTVGLTGLVLVGGQGVLSRKHGITADFVKAVEVVTADGKVVVASEEEHKELLWLAKGGGAYPHYPGVITRMLINFIPAKWSMRKKENFINWRIDFEATPEMAAKLFEFWQHFAPTADPSLTCELWIRLANDKRRRKRFPKLYLSGVYQGAHAKWLTIEDKIKRAVGEGTGKREDRMSMLEFVMELGNATTEAEMRSGRHGWDLYEGATVYNRWKGLSMVANGSLADMEVIKALAAAVWDSGGAPSWLPVVKYVEFKPLGGAIEGAGQDSAAFWHRGARWWALMSAFWHSSIKHSRDLDAFLGHWGRAHRSVAAGLRREGVYGGQYVGYINHGGHASPREELEAYYGGNVERMQAIRRRWDPQGLFQHSRWCREERGCALT